MKEIVPYIVFEALSIEDDEVKFRISISNIITVSSIDIYGYLDQFKSFGEQLKEFPKTIDDTVVYELGDSEGEWAYHLLFKVFCYNASGHTAILIKIDNKMETPDTNKVEFFIKTLPSSINRFGINLMSWDPRKNNTFQYTSF